MSKVNGGLKEDKALSVEGPKDLPGEAEISAEIQKAETQGEIFAAIMSAKKFPRDEQKSQADMLAACDSELFAEKAYYSFPRGKQIVSGASIRMAKEITRTYGNIRWGFFITHDDDDARGIVSWAWDLERNNRTSASDFFKKLIQRKQENGPTIWVTADERDLRELTFRRASIIERNCILSLLPAHFIDELVVVCKRTVAGGERTDLKERTSIMSKAFGDIGVSPEQLENYLGHPLKAATREEVADLRGVYQSIVDGIISPQEKAAMFSSTGKSQPTTESESGRPPLTEQQVRDAFKEQEAGQEPEAEGSKGPIEDEKKTKSKKPIVAINLEQRKRLFALAKKGDKTKEGIKEYIEKTYNLSSTTQIPSNLYDDICKWAETPVAPPDEKKKDSTKKTTAGKDTKTKGKIKAPAPAVPNDEPLTKESVMELIENSDPTTFFDNKAKIMQWLKSNKEPQTTLDVAKSLSLKQKEVMDAGGSSK